MSRRDVIEFDAECARLAALGPEERMQAFRDLIGGSVQDAVRHAVKGQVGDSVRAMLDQHFPTEVA